ncbi:MAG TPA: nicotinate-nucleotide--dimethylbenzimidazole phosphoribosyltransferase [Gaiellaceae bacterium]|nr:nicotinate-nucleotide--dimethylbenzimidazole phosphoribosyltransferase [Gaiellaceae bacterium]
MPVTADRLLACEDELARLAAAVPPLSRGAAAAARRELDRKTKPRGSLGRLEELAIQVAAVCGNASPRPLRPCVVVVAADHGVADEGVSAYPPEVTRQMVATFVGGGAAICVLARHAGARLVLVDAGVRVPVADPAVRDLRLGPGTANAARGPAMARATALDALLAGARLAAELAAGGTRVVCLGEMGIGNTTAAAAIAAALLGLDAHAACGPGTGLDEAGLRRKRAVVARMLEVNRPDAADAVDVLRAVGGFEIAVLAGLVLGAARERMLVLLDGFITGAAALIAVRLAPRAAGFLVASHRSAEPAHGAVLDALGLPPLLDLGLRLGEGSGAALALPLVSAAVGVLEEMATFADAGVSDSGR